MLSVAICPIAKAQIKTNDAVAESQAENSVSAVENEIIISNYFSNTNCETKGSESVKLENTIVSGAGACLEIVATEAIDLESFFDSEVGSTFDARIIEELPEPPPTTVPPTDPVTPTDPDPVTPDPPTVPTVPDENKVCENFQNHGPANPHLYAQASSNSFVGDMIAKYTPEYKIEGLTDWMLMNNAGAVQPGSEMNYCYFKYPSDGQPHNIWLRTKAGCQEYPDIRNTQVYTNTLEEFQTLHTNLPAINPRVIDTYFMANSELEGRQAWEEIPMYNFYTDRVVDNLKIRMVTDVGMVYEEFHLYTYPMFPVRANINKMESPALFPKKDFIIDMSTDDFRTAARYTVYRNYQGGHWSTVTTMTRHDGHVTLTAQGINWDTDQTVINLATGQSYSNIPGFGNVFDLGFLADGDYVFAVKTYHGVTMNDHLVIKVKRPPLN